MPKETINLVGVPDWAVDAIITEHQMKELVSLFSLPCKTCKSSAISQLTSILHLHRQHIYLLFFMSCVSACICPNTVYLQGLTPTICASVHLYVQSQYHLYTLTQWKNTFKSHLLSLKLLYRSAESLRMGWVFYFLCLYPENMRQMYRLHKRNTRLWYLTNCPCHTILNPWCYLKFSNQRSSKCCIDAMTDRQSIHMASNIKFPKWNCSNHRLPVQTQRLICSTLPFAFLSPTFPVNYHSTDRWKTAHLSTLRATSAQVFPKVLIAKSYEKLEIVAFEDSSLWNIRAYKWLPLSPNWT